MSKYATIKLSRELVEELRVWKMAFSAAYGRKVSYTEIIRGLFDSIEDSDPGVQEEFERILEQHPEFMEPCGE